MQFIEKNSFNLRSAVYRLSSPDTNIKFTLLPMIHVGSREFYDEVSRRLSTCDLILAEGVNSKRASFLTLSYRIVSKFRAVDLVTQNEALNLSTFGDNVISTDVDSQRFDSGWAALPIQVRAVMMVAVPFFIVYMLLNGTRETIARELALEDLPSNDEVLMQDDDLEQFDKLIVVDRDQKLIEHIERLHTDGSQQSRKVAVLYGAAHMRAVVAFLMNKLKYRVVKAEWIKVFDV